MKGLNTWLVCCYCSFNIILCQITYFNNMRNFYFILCDLFVKNSHRQDDLVVKEGKFKQSQAVEVVALHKRIQTGKEEQKKQRLLHLER